MSAKSDKDVVIDAVLKKLRKQLEEQISDQDQTLDQIEETASRIGRSISQEIENQVVQKQSKKPRPPKQSCSCGGQARYKGEQPRQIVTRNGVLALKRACYYCSVCHKTLSPADKVLGLDAGSTTIEVRAWVAYLCAMLPFAEAATTLELLTRISLSASTMERISLLVGQSLRTQQKEEARLHHLDHLPESEFKPRRLYIGMDGVFAPLRDAWSKNGSQGELVCRFGECKVGVVYEPLQDELGRDHKISSRAYVSTLESVETFGPLIGTLAHQQGHHQAKEVLVIGDGAVWIWQIAAKQFMGAVQIVDFFHACQHLAKLAECRFGKGSEAGALWLSARKEDLKQNRITAVLDEIRDWKPRAEAKRKTRRDEYRYFYKNAKRMRYKTFLELGYHIGSGVVEAGCKQNVTQRLKLVGMHWRQETAEAIVTLRSAQLSTRPPDLRPHCAMAA
jgi:hypothetical protein